MQAAILRTEKPGRPPAWTRMMAQIQQVREVKFIIISTAMRVPLELIVVVSDGHGSHPSLCSEIALSAKSAKYTKFVLMSPCEW